MRYRDSDPVPSNLCTCETYWECEWHRRLRDRDTNAMDLESEMKDIMDTSQAVWWGYESPEPGWELIEGRPCYHWRPQ